MLYELQNLKKQFGDRTVLDIASLSFERGKVYALIGPNGAGKTTLLNHLAFLELQSSGCLSFRNQLVPPDNKQLVKLRKNVVLVDQSPILFSGTVWKNVEFGLKVRNISKRERASRIEAALERVGMQRFALADVHGLSGGEVKRVALARALAVNPEVLLCDEPTANVDQENQEVILKILERANKIQHTSVIFSTHYLSQSRRLADHTVLLQNGKISFEHTENTLKVKSEKIGAGKVRLRLVNGDRRVLGELRSSELADGRYRVHLAAEKVLLHKRDDREGSGQPLEPVIVKKIVGDNSMIRVSVDAGVVLDVIMSRADYQEQRIMVGEEMALELPAEALSIREVLPAT